MLSMLLNLVLFYSFPEMMTFRFPDQPFPATEIMAADQVICVLISDDAQHIFICQHCKLKFNQQKFEIVTSKGKP